MLFDLGIAAPIAAIALTVGLFVSFTFELRSADVLALSAAAMALVLGLVTIDDVLRAVANPAPITIAAMFVLSAALVRTGVLEALTIGLKRNLKSHPTLTIIAFFASAGAASAFINNTPVVMVLIPVVIALAQEMKIGPSKLLIPLSYMAVLGGTCSLIGTSTNLLVDGVARDLQMEPFSLFEITPLGIAVALTGGAYLAIAAPRWLPDRPTQSGAINARRSRAWLAELFVPPGSELIGRSVLDVQDFRRGHGRVLDVIRGDVSMRAALEDVRLQAGDIVVVKTRDTEIMGFREGAAAGVAIAGTEPTTMRSSTVVEALVGPNARVVGRIIGRRRWRRHYGVYPMAIHRMGNAIDLKLATLRLQVGDTLLLDGTEEDINRLAEDEGLILVSAATHRTYRRRKAPLAIAIMCAVIILGALNVAPILTLALIGAASVLVTKCVDPDEGIGAVDGRLLILIVSMLIVGAALDRTGGLTLIVDWLAPVLGKVSPLVALALVYAVTSILTEIVTNNAVAVLMTPIAATIASQLGLDPRPFVVVVMFAASASFATPIGYQTNTLVYNVGGYKFADFLRIGIPMNILAGAVTVLLTPVFWPM
jgi:di/tricarboxylate transporter